MEGNFRNYFNPLWNCKLFRKRKEAWPLTLLQLCDPKGFGPRSIKQKCQFNSFNQKKAKEVFE